MNYRQLSSQDEELIAAAFEVAARGHREDCHQVGAAIRAGSGKIYAGVHMESPGVDVCAEWVALGMAASAGEREFTCAVAVSGPAPDGCVMSPCGVCRELLYFYGPDMEVIVPHEAGPRKVRVSELLPIPYADDHPAP